MGERSNIEWTTATWNPWRGCDKVSPGCAHCYMFRDQERWGNDPTIVERTSPATFRAPLSVKRFPAGAMVFTCSWSDWFHPNADEWRDDAWAIVRARPDLTFQILTKRPELVLERLPADWGNGYPNVWMGVSIENRRFVGRADLLRAIPAAVRFISAEPLLGPLVPVGTGESGCRCFPSVEALGTEWPDGYTGPALSTGEIDWVIAGGESGPGHRRMDAQWVRDLRDTCAHTRTAFFFKQWGGPKPGGDALLDAVEHKAYPSGR